MGPKADIDRLELKLFEIVSNHGYKWEVKWKNLSPRWLRLYIELVDELFVHLTNYEVRYRQAFRDRSFVYVPDPDEPPASILDVEFKMCFQFLKHAFGIKFLPPAVGNFDKVVIRLDNHSSQKHKKQLTDLAEKLPTILTRTDLEIDCSHVCSKRLMRIQICDVMAGAAGSYGNRMHEKRAPGQRGMGTYQKCRYILAKHIYAKLHSLNNLTRGKSAFNWFESTGMDGSQKNLLSHKMRIWKFIPSNYMIDKGWQNDHLDAQGNYIRPDIVAPQILEKDEF